ncbi:MAG: GNAT family N-acetyltransferase [Sciscionella sp.]|nr:GNAT family N-acetyltransferase [Sciscionella sp.]
MVRQARCYYLSSKCGSTLNPPGRLIDMDTSASAAPVLRDDIAAVSVTLAKAFADDPVFRWLIGDDEGAQSAGDGSASGTGGAHIVKRAPALFAVLCRRLMVDGGAWCTAGAESAALWTAPNRWRTNIFDLARWAPPAVSLFGRHTLRALRALSSMEREHPRRAHWYLSVLGTAPEHQGNGFGSAALTPMLARCDRDRLPAYLEAIKASTVPFYERHGFRVTATHDLSAIGPRLHLMWRDPASSA